MAWQSLLHASVSANISGIYNFYLRNQPRFYNFAFSTPLPTPFFSFSTILQVHSPYGTICAAYSFAVCPLACLKACLAAIPCIITEPRNPPKALPQPSSADGSYPDSSAYHLTTS